MTVNHIMSQLESYGNQNVKNMLLKHGVKEPFFGVKVEHLKIIQKKIKMDYKLANELFQTKNADAMYLAGLIADDKQMTKQDLQNWVILAVSNNICTYTVPWVAAGSKHGFQLGIEWIDSNEQHIAVAGWSTLGAIAANKADSELNLNSFKSLLSRVVSNIHSSGNLERQAMNNFIISVGAYIEPLTKDALAAALKIGKVTADMNGTACKIPHALDYINKISDKGLIGRKKKVLKC